MSTTVKIRVKTDLCSAALAFRGEGAEVGVQLRQVLDVLLPAPVPAPSSQEGADAAPRAPEPSFAPPQVPEENKGEATPGGDAPVALNGTRLDHLSFSTLSLLFRCAHAFHLKLAGIKPPPSEDMQIGLDFHAGVAAYLRGEEAGFMFDINNQRVEHIKDLLLPLRSSPDLRVEPRAELVIDDLVWVGYADALARGTIYEFKTMKRLPAEPLDAHRIQASIYAAMFSAVRAEIVYVSEKGARSFTIEPLANVEAFLAEMARQIRAGVPNIPTGLTHPYGCDGCEYRTYCRFYEFIRSRGLVTELPF